MGKEDSYTIKYKFVKNDSILYLVKNLNSDDLVSNESELSVDKFIFNKKTNTINNFYFETLYNFQKLNSKKTITNNDIHNIGNETGGHSYGI